MNKRIESQINKCLDQMEKEPIAITLDWLSIYLTDENLTFYGSYNDGDTIEINSHTYLRYESQATLHFDCHFLVIYHGEEVAHLLAKSRSEIIFKKEIVKIEFINHTFYSGKWVDVYSDLLSWGLVYKGVGRCDIAIDGLNGLHRLLNIYAKQSVRTRTMWLKNSSEKRSLFSAKVLNPKTLSFENFNIGSKGGNKMVTVYNKTLEIAKSGKQYIADWWLKNGVIDKFYDANKAAKQVQAEGEAINILGTRNIYRFELRLKSESIKEIDKFSIELLTTPTGLASILQLHCRKYFEGSWNDNDNPSRRTDFNLVPFHRLEAVPLVKIVRLERDGEYKAKMTIHGLISDVYKANIRSELYNECFETIMDRCRRYDLFAYLKKKIPQWYTAYNLSTPDPDRKSVSQFFDALNYFIFKDENEDLVIRHMNSKSTSNFGE